MGRVKGTLEKERQIAGKMEQMDNNVICIQY